MWGVLKPTSSQLMYRIRVQIEVGRQLELQPLSSGQWSAFCFCRWVHLVQQWLRCNRPMRSILEELFDDEWRRTTKLTPGMPCFLAGSTFRALCTPAALKKTLLCTPSITQKRPYGRQGRIVLLGSSYMRFLRGLGRVWTKQYRFLVGRVSRVRFESAPEQVPTPESICFFCVGGCEG